MRAVRSQVHIPVFAMTRPRAGDFFYSEMEFKQMRAISGLPRAWVWMA